MRIAVVGSRDWSDKRQVWRALEQVFEGLAGEPLHVVSGGARGADGMAAEWARVMMTERRNVQLTEHLPDWRRFGRSAGFRRNRLIVEGADLVLAFQRGGSRGTQHSIDLAKAAGIRVVVWREA